MDLDADKVERLQRGEAPFREPGLDDLLRDGINAGRLRLSTSAAEAARDARVAVHLRWSSPVGRGDRSLAAVEEAARQIARNAPDGVVLVTKSTVPPGTTGRIAKVVRLERPDLDFVTVSNLLREGDAIRDTLEPDRLVVGADNRRGLDVMRELYLSPCCGTAA